MSHFVGLVFGDAVGYKLEPYDEDLEVPPHRCYTLDEALISSKELIEGIKKYGTDKQKERVNSLITNEDYISFYADFNDFDLEEDGLYTRYNDNAKWDWYQEGGRFSGWLKCLDGFAVDSAEVGEIDWDKTNIPFCFVTDEGEWIEKGQMGWWCIVENEKDKLTWEEEFKEYVKSLPKDMLVTVIDFHI